jgi:hypothetical protein
VVALTATSVPWPEADETGGVRKIARVTNLVYSLLLPVLLVGAIVAVRHGFNQLVLPLAHLATPFMAALVFMGEPR